MFTDSTPINCALIAASEFVTGTINVPQIPANKCAGTAPTTSSIFSENSSLVPNTTIIPPIPPIKSLSLHLTNVNSSYGLAPFIDYKKLWEENK